MQITRAILNMIAAAALLLVATVAQARQGDQGYVLGPEDVITITVVDQAKFSGEYVIPSTGKIILPVGGEVTVAGLTVVQVRDLYTTQLKKRLVRPEVIVALKVARPQRIYVFGDVRAPGILDFKPGWSVSEGLSAAGGLTTGILSGDVTVSIERSGGKRTSVPLDKALSASGEDRLKLEAGDVLRFETAQLISIYVNGQVKAPGLFKVRANEAGVMEAISQAGGLLPDANMEQIKVTHLDGPSEVINLAPLFLGMPTPDAQPVKLPRLGNGDMVVVPQSQDRFAILGYVAKPSYYPIPSGQKYTLSQAIALAGGSAGGRLSRVGIIRTENGKETRKIYDAGKFLVTGDPTLNPAIQPGDVIYVPESAGVDLRTILSGISTAGILFRAVGK